MFSFAASVHNHTAAPAAWPSVRHGFSGFPRLFRPWPRSDALASAPKPGQAHRRIPPNKKTYQQDPANFREVRRRLRLCLLFNTVACRLHQGAWLARCVAQEITLSIVVDKLLVLSPGGGQDGLLLPLQRSSLPTMGPPPLPCPP